jgi:hypothetical protein
MYKRQSSLLREEASLENLQERSLNKLEEYQEMKRLGVIEE